MESNPYLLNKEFMIIAICKITEWKTSYRVGITIIMNKMPSTKLYITWYVATCFGLK